VLNIWHHPSKPRVLALISGLVLGATDFIMAFLFQLKQRKWSRVMPEIIRHHPLYFPTDYAEKQSERNRTD
jgi:hypothetical protein